MTPKNRTIPERLQQTSRIFTDADRLNRPMSSANYGLPLLEHFVNGSTVRNPRSEIRAESVIVAVALHTRSRLQNWLPGMSHLQRARQRFEDAR